MLWKKNGITTAPQPGPAARSPQKGDTRGIKKKSHLILSFLLHLKASLECLFILSSWKACFPNRNSAPVLQCLSQQQEPSTLQSTHLPSCAQENETVYFIYWDTSLQHLSIRLDEHKQVKHNLVTDLKQWGWEHTIHICIAAAKAGCKSQRKHLKKNSYYSS